jgi:hypothetical protein
MYNRHVSEVMGYPERGYCFRRGEDVFLMWDGYFDDLMRAMWTLYGYEPDPDDPDHPNLGQVPLLREWNEQSWIGTRGPFQIAELPATVHAVRDAVTELGRRGPNIAESPQHGEALATYLEQAVATGQAVSVEEWWGSAELPTTSPG